MKHEGVTRRIIRLRRMKVHSALGNGFQVVIYQRAMGLEMPFENLVFKREMEMPVHYRNEIIGTRRVVFLWKKL